MPERIATSVIAQSTIAARASAITIHDEATLQAARDFLVDVKTTWTNIETERVSIKKPLDEAVNRVQLFFRKILAPLETAEQIVKPKIARHLADLEAARQAEERRQREAAEAQRRDQEAQARLAQEAADRERARAEQEARDAQAEADRQERIRIEAERQGKSDVAARAAARSAELSTAASNALQAGEQKAAAHMEQAGVAMTTAAAIATPSVERSAKPAGTSLRWKYSTECSDFKALCLAIGQGRAPITLAKFEQGVADRMAGTMKDSFEGAYPGVKLIKTPDVTQRTK